MEKTARIFVAGHRGLVGSALVRSLLAAGHNPQSLILRTRQELDLTDQAAVNDFFAHEKPEYVLLAAAKVGGIHANNTYPAEFIRDNLAIQINVIHAAWQNNVKRLMFLGSSCIYPKFAPQPMKEEHLLTGPLEETNRPYALAKISGIEMCWSYNRQYGTQYLAVMPTNLYGPGDNYDLMNSHVLPAMIRKFHLAKLAQQGDLAGIMRDEAVNGEIPKYVKAMLGLTPQSSLLSPEVPSSLIPHPSVLISRPQSSVLNSRPQSSVLNSRPQSSVLSPQSSVTIWGTGTPKRELLYNEDMANACIFLMNLQDEEFSAVLSPQPSAPPLINIGTGIDVTIAKLAHLVKEIVGYSGDVAFDTSKPDGPPRKLLDIGRLAELGWEPKIDLRTGIERAYRDFLNNAR